MAVRLPKIRCIRETDETSRCGNRHYRSRSYISFRMVSGLKTSAIFSSRTFTENTANVPLLSQNCTFARPITSRRQKSVSRPRLSEECANQIRFLLPKAPQHSRVQHPPCTGAQTFAPVLFQIQEITNHHPPGAFKFATLVSKGCHIPTEN